MTLDESGVRVRSGKAIHWQRVRACAVRKTGLTISLRFFLYPSANEGIGHRRFEDWLPDHYDIRLGFAEAGPILTACAAWIAAARASRPLDEALDRIDAQKGD